MSSPINNLGSSQVLKQPKTQATRQVNNETEEKIQEHLKDTEEKIQFWKSKATRDHIDISQEKRDLSKLTPGQGLSLSDIVAKKATICIRIRRKVTLGATGPARIDELRQKLFDLTNTTVVPWIKLARQGGIDIDQEWEAMHQANLRALESTQEEDKAREITLKNLIVIRTGNTCRIIQKCFESMINGIGVGEIRKEEENKERMSIIATLTKEALARLTCEGSLSDFEKHCKEVFECFQKNINLYNENPEEYHRQADREWLLRSIKIYSAKMITYADLLDKPDFIEAIQKIQDKWLCSLQDGKEVSAVQEGYKRDFESCKKFHLSEDREILHWNIFEYSEKMCSAAQVKGFTDLADQIWESRKIALQMIKAGVETKEIQEKVELVFELVTSRLGMNPLLGGCGFKDRPSKRGNK